MTKKKRQTKKQPKPVKWTLAQIQARLEKLHFLTVDVNDAKTSATEALRVATRSANDLIGLGEIVTELQARVEKAISEASEAKSQAQRAAPPPGDAIAELKHRIERVIHHSETAKAHAELASAAVAGQSEKVAGVAKQLTDRLDKLERALERRAGQIENLSVLCAQRHATFLDDLGRTSRFMRGSDPAAGSDASERFTERTPRPPFRASDLFRDPAPPRVFDGREFVDMPPRYQDPQKEFMYQAPVPAGPLATRPPKTHDLKIWPEFFAAVADGSKVAELRRNDRDFRVGDILLLREFVPMAIVPGGGKVAGYTGRALDREITSIITDTGREGLRPGWCVLSLKRLADVGP